MCLQHASWAKDVTLRYPAHAAPWVQSITSLFKAHADLDALRAPDLFDQDPVRCYFTALDDWHQLRQLLSDVVVAHPRMDWLIVAGPWSWMTRPSWRTRMAPRLHKVAVLWEDTALYLFEPDSSRRGTQVFWFHHV